MENIQVNNFQDLILNQILYLVVHPFSSNSSQPIIPSGLTARPFERRALNYLINEYLLINNYKVTSVTFGEENDTSDLEDWDNVGLNCARPPDLSQLYRWYCHQLSIDNEKPTKEDFSMFVNFDEKLQDEYKNLKITVQQMVYLSFFYFYNKMCFVFLIY
jgi:hypothetical protein